MFSIIIPTLNNLDYLKLCIKSIKNTTSLNNEILVHVSVDSDNATRDFLKRTGIKYTFTEENVGLCTAINIIAASSKQKILDLFSRRYVFLSWMGECFGKRD